MSGNATIGALRVMLGLDSAQFTKGLDAAQKQLKKTADSFKATGDAMAGIGAGLTVAVTGPLIALGTAMAKAAIDAGEMQSAFAVSFGAMTKQTEAWARKTGDALGRSTTEIEEATLAFHGLFKAGGPASEQTAELAKQFAVLAQDLASFHNVDPTTALEKLRSGLSGEAEPLRDFNVYLTEAAVKAEGMRLGLKQVGGELTEQSKIQARASLILKGTAEAQGDVARTADSTANRIRAAQAAWQELSVTIGSQILPAITPLIQGLGDALNAFGKLSPALQQTTVGALAVAAALGPIVGTVGLVVGGIGELITVATSVSAALAASGGAAAGLGAAMTALAGPLGVIALAVGAVTAALIAMKLEQARVDAANRQTVQTMGGARDALDEYAKAVKDAGLASGEAKTKALEHANAMRQEALAAVQAAKAMREKAIAAAEAAEAAATQTRRNADPRTLGGFANAWMAAQGGFGAAGISPAAEASARMDQAAERARSRAKAATEAAAAAEKRYAAILRQETAPAVAAAGAATSQAAATTRGLGDAASKAAADSQELDQALKSVLDGLATDGERQLRETNEALLTLRKGLDAGKISVEQFNDAVDRLFAPKAAKSGIFDDEGLSQPFKAAEAQFDEYLEDQEEAYAASLDRMGDSFAGFFQGWIATGKADWKRLLLDLTRSWQDTMAVLARSAGGLGGVLSKVLSGVGGAISGMSIGQGMGLGTGNSTADLGLSIGGSIAGGLLASSSFAGTIGAGIANGIVGLGGSAALAGTLGTLLSSAAVLGPIGAIAGLAIGTLFKKKPSNNGALATFNGDSFSLSGNKRTDETSQMATQASQAYLAGKKAAEQLGISFTDAVKSFDLGTRDLTDIILTSGRALTAGVGDAAGAAETALKAMLEGANYASDAQRSLVQSMLAAGRSFDEIVTSLGKFSEAQAIPQAIADAIQQLQDPQAFDLTQLKRQQEARRAEIEAQLKAGYLTAQQFEALSAQLETLEGLELDKATGKFQDQATRTAAAQAAVADAQAALEASYRRERGQIEDSINKFKALAERLRAFGKSLAAATAATGGDRLRLAEQELDRVSKLAQLGNTDAMEDLQGVGEDYLAVLQDFAPDALTYLKGVAKVQAATEAAAQTADRQVSIGEQQLASLNAMVAGLIPINDGILGVQSAIDNLKLALTGLAEVSGRKWGLNPSANAALAEATGYADDFGEGGFQAWIEKQDEAVKAKARAVLRSFGQDYRVGFATGGSFKVGGYGGTDSQLMSFRATPGEMIDIRRPGQQSELANAVRWLSSQLLPSLRATALNTSRSAGRLDQFELDGMPETRNVA